VAIGVGLGLTQGLIVGVLIGGVLVLANALLTWRRQSRPPPPRGFPLDDVRPY
jgi:hypothetical protein